MFSPKHTKIVCTIGPSSESVAILEKMIRAGMNMARLNFSHGTHANHRMLVRNIRTAAKRAGVPVAILGDLQGPKVRVGVLPSEGVLLTTGASITFRAGTETMNNKIIPIPYAGLAKDLKRGDRILLDDGLLEVKVTGISDRDIRCQVIIGGILTSHKGFNVPTATLHLPAVTKKDFDDLQFALAEGVDYIALSFVRNAKEIRAVRRRIDRQKKDRGVKIIAKIEKHEAITHFDEILEVVDAIMVARGDLAVETAAEDVPILQKRIIEKCLSAAKPVIVATQMLDSMIRNPRPTRAEVSDVANAVMDHTDAVMLSGETATGKYPLEAVSTMAKIIHETEASHYDDLAVETIRDRCRTQGEALAEVATLASCTPKTTLIVVTTSSGKTARLVSRFRPEVPMLGLATDPRVVRQLALTWGITPVVMKPVKTIEAVFLAVQKIILAGAFAKKKEKAVVVTGDRVGQSGQTNLIKIIEI